MKIQRQSEIFEAMVRSDFYPHAVTAIESRDTHISKVFLTGTFAYKIKKAVNLGFLDFTTLEKRQHFCKQEVVLNRRLSPNVYIGVVAITFKDGRYYLSGPGTPIEYAVKMRQLPEDRSMVRLLRNKKLDWKSIDELARTLAGFYNQALTSERIDTVGSWETVWTNCEENFEQTEPFVEEILDKSMFQIIRAATRSFLLRRKALFQRRIEDKKMRDCHGDLRTGHIYFTNGVQIIDCIEFNSRFRYADITSDLAFLAMDLDFEGYPQAAQNIIEKYLEYAKDPEMFILLDFYKCYRAYVRAKVNCFRLQEKNLTANEKARLLRDTHRYMGLAFSYAVRFSRPTIWVVCGLPASGKSTIATALSKIINVKALSSDVIRKELFGIQPFESIDLPYGNGIYSKGATSLVYGKLLMLAQEEIEKSCSVILEATYGSQHQRDEAIRLAKDMDTNIIFIECVASSSTLKKRLTKRNSMNTVSDARLHHFKKLNANFESLNGLRDELHIRVSTEVALNESMKQILSHEYVSILQQSAETLQKINGNPFYTDLS